MKYSNLLFCFTLIFSCYTHAGVIVGGTRLVYENGKKESSITVKNPENSTPYLIQAWVDNAGQNDDNKSAAKPPFIITPPLFRLDAGTENALRVVKMAGAEQLPKDKESVFWLDIKSIPAQSKNPDGTVAKNRLQISVKTRIKLFFRPDNIPDTPEEASTKLIFKKSGNTLIVTNPTPYYFTFNSLKVGGSNVKSFTSMVPPKGETKYVLNSNDNTVKWNYINDFGGVSKTVSTTL